MQHTPGSLPGVLTAEIMAYLQHGSVEIGGAEGEVLVRRGDPGVGFWVVLEGTVEVRLVDTDGVHLPLARLGPGSTFGEMALVTGEAVSADVVALTTVRLLRYPADRFEAALGECAPLRAMVLARMAANLRGTNTEVWNFYQQARALNVVMGPHRGTGPLVAESAAMRPICDMLARRAQDELPVMISGAPGSGKLYVAAKIHEAKERSDAPFIVVDCRAVEASEAMRFLFGAEDGFNIDTIADTAGALRHYGALQLAHGGTLVLRHVNELPGPVQAALGRYAAGRREGKLEYPVTRLALTTDLAAAALAQALDRSLTEALDGAIISLPRLHERRKDIMPLARLFLAERSTQAPHSLSRGAEHLLLSQRYDHRNVAELREAIDLAAMVADEPLIQPEHIFAGARREDTVKQLDLGGFTLVRRLTSPRMVMTVRIGLFAMFVTILAASLLWSDDRRGTVANALIWGVWEPALLVAFFVVGRVWCTVCPLSTAGRLAARLGTAGIAPGTLLKKYSAWLIAAGFALVLWSEHVFVMTERPRAAGFLLLALFGGAVTSALIWRREAWCRYLCPLGNLGAVYALPAVLSVRSNPNVCSTMCVTHECFKGSGHQPGCPVFHHPLNATEMNTCKLCLQCLQVCPHGSARLYLRLPLQSLWAQHEVGASLVPFALFLFFFAPAMLASQGGSWVATSAGFTATTCAALLAAAIAAAGLPRLLATGKDRERALSSRLVFALLVLAWGPAMAFQLGHIGALASLQLHAAPASALATLLPADGVKLLTVAQVLVILIAGALGTVCLAGIHARMQREQEPFSRAGWRCVSIAGGLYQIAVLALLAGS